MCFGFLVGTRLEVLMMRKRIQMGRPEVGHIRDSAVVDSTRPDRGEGVLKISAGLRFRCCRLGSGVLGKRDEDGPVCRPPAVTDLRVLQR